MPTLNDGTPVYTVPGGVALDGATGQLAMGTPGVLRDDQGNALPLYDLNRTPITGVTTSPVGTFPDVYTTRIEGGQWDFGTVQLRTDTLELRAAGVRAQEIAQGAVRDAASTAAALEAFPLGGVFRKAAQDAAAALLTSGKHEGIRFSYDGASGLTATVTATGTGGGEGTGTASGIALDDDGTPYFASGADGAAIAEDTDGTPYYSPTAA